MTALSDMFQNALSPLVATGIIPVDTAKSIAARAWMVALQALGVEDAGDLTTLEAFGVGVDSEPSQSQEPTASPLERDLAERQVQAIAQRDVALEQALAAIEAAAGRMGRDV